MRLLHLGDDRHRAALLTVSSKPTEQEVRAALDGILPAAAATSGGRRPPCSARSGTTAAARPRMVTAGRRRTAKKKGTKKNWPFWLAAYPSLAANPAPSSWLAFSPDGTVTIRPGKVEYGPRPSRRPA